MASDQLTWDEEELVVALARDGVDVETIAARCGVTLAAVAEALADFVRTSDP